jgi:hypothetical protein
MNPHCPVCGSDEVAIVSAGMTCLSCAFHESRIVPTAEYDQMTLMPVCWSKVQRIKQQSRIRAGQAIADFLAGRTIAPPPDRRDRGPDELPGQQHMFDREDFRVSSDQKELFDA